MWEFPEPKRARLHTFCKVEFITKLNQINADTTGSQNV